MTFEVLSKERSSAKVVLCAEWRRSEATGTESTNECWAFGLV